MCAFSRTSLETVSNFPSKIFNGLECAHWWADSRPFLKTVSSFPIKMSLETVSSFPTKIIDGLESAHLVGKFETVFRNGLEFAH